MNENVNQEKLHSSKRFEEERHLWVQCAAGDEAARDELILAYRPMVYWLAKKLRVPYNTYPDLIQEGMIALINAVDGFDVLRNNRFSTYAYYKIRGRMINFLQRSEARAPIPVEDSVFAEEDARVSMGTAEASRSEWTIDLEHAMSQLSNREADVLNALIIEGRVAREVAEEKSIDVSHVYRIRRKAIEKLRKLLGIDEATSSI